MLHAAPIAQQSKPDKTTVRTSGGCDDDVVKDFGRYLERGWSSYAEAEDEWSC